MCDAEIVEFRRKADHNKAESQAFFVVAIVFSLASPAFVTLSNEWLWGKAVPAVLSLLAAGATTWIQVRKPQQLWAIYRDAQRRLEYERALHEIQSDPYDTRDRDKILVRAVLRIKRRTHQKWLLLLPSAERLALPQPDGRREGEKEDENDEKEDENDDEKEDEKEERDRGGA